MSDKPKLLPSGETTKSLFTIRNFLMLLGVIAALTWGIFKILVFAGADVFNAVKPQAVAAVGEVKKFSPGAPEVVISIGGKDYTLFSGQEPGPDWTQLTGNSGWGGSSGGSGSGGGDQGTPVDEVPVPGPPAGATQEELQAQYDGLAKQFIGLVGGTQTPDYSALESTDVKPARLVLAQMKSLGVDLVQPAQWEAQLESNIKSKFEDCFTAKSITCVRQWNPIQIGIDNDPPGLREWVISLIDKPNDLADLVSAASNTNVSAIVQTELENAYKKAVAERKKKACDTMSSGQFSPIDMEWCFGGISIEISITDGPLQLPKEIGGNAGVLDPNDTIKFLYVSGSQKASLEVPYEIAVDVIPGLNFNTKSYSFPETPNSWDPSKWSPGQPIP